MRYRLTDPTTGQTYTESTREQAEVMADLAWRYRGVRVQITEEQDGEGRGN